MAQQIATKEEERKALDKIRKIIESLGEQSHVGTAFTGAFQIAENNIENDEGSSVKEYVGLYFKNASELADKDVEMKEKDAQLDDLRNQYATLRKNSESEYEYMKNRVAKAEDTLQEESRRANKAEEKNKELAMEIITLKAKLYDLLVKETAA